MFAARNEIDFSQMCGSLQRAHEEAFFGSAQMAVADCCTRGCAAN